MMLHVRHLSASIILIYSSRTAKTQDLETIANFLKCFRGCKEASVSAGSYIACVLVTDSIILLLLHTGATQSC